MNRQERSVAAIVAAAQESIAEREEVLREIVAAGWEPLDASVGLEEGGIVSDVTARGTYADRGRPGTESFIRLHVSFWEGGIAEIEADGPSHGVRVFIGNGKIPTPDEADEAYHAELRKSGAIVARWATPTLAGAAVRPPLCHRIREGE